MVAVPAGKGTIDLPQSLVAAVIRQASENAVSTAAIVSSWKAGRGRDLKMPPALLAEIGSLSVLMKWETLGLFDVLDDQWPALEQIKEEFLNRCHGGLKAFSDPNETPITGLMLKKLTEDLSWDAPELLDASFRLDAINEDEFVDNLAKFLWEHRRTILQVLNEESRREEAK